MLDQGVLGALVVSVAAVLPVTVAPRAPSEAVDLVNHFQVGGW